MLELISSIPKLEMSALVGKFFRHYKGKYYYVYNISTHTETNEKLVNYINLELPINNWSRPLLMWNDLVDGRPRFTQVIPFDEHLKTMKEHVNKC